MKHISDIATIACINSARDERLEKNNLDPVCTQLVDKIFIKLALLCREYDAMYADKRRENAEKLQWVLAFTKHKIKTKQQIQYALDQLDLHKWGKPPQLGQFLEWCKPKPEHFGFPGTQEAFRISGLINQSFSTYIHTHIPTDTVIKHVIDQIGPNSFRAMTEKNAFKLFESYYEIASRQFMQGDMEPIQRALTQEAPQESSKEKSDEVRKKHMEDIRKILNASNNKRMPENYI